MAVDRLLRLGGVAFVVVVVISVLVAGGTPDWGARANEVASFYGDEPVRQKLSAFVLAASMPFLLFFAASLAGFRRPADERPHLPWRWVLLGGSAVAAATIAIGAMIHLALADAAGATTPEGLQVLNVLDGHVVYVLAAATGVMMLGAAGWLVGRAGTFGWLGRTALVLGVAAFIPLISVLALLLSFVWIVVTSVALFRASSIEDHSVDHNRAGQGDAR